MAEIRGGFFENIYYKAEDFALSHEAIITQGVVADVTEGTKDALLVIPGEEMQVVVNPGYCWIKGAIGVFFGCAPAKVYLPVPSADATYTRIDRVIVRKNSNNKTFSIEVLKGIASSAPEAPALTRNGTIDEICLAEIFVPAGAIEITESMIVDKRHDTSVCGISQSALNKLDTSKVFAGYEAQWAELMGQLAADPAGNLQLQIGLLSNLETENKRNLVEAINESMHIIDGIPVDLTGIYNTQVIGFNEASGKLVPMINVARTIELADGVRGVWEVVEMTGFTELSEDDSTYGFLIIKGNTSESRGTAKIKTINPYIISEFVNLNVYLWSTSGTNRLLFSKSPDFSTIEAQFNLVTSSNYDISNLIGKYYMMLEIGGTGKQCGVQDFTLS